MEINHGKIHDWTINTQWNLFAKISFESKVSVSDFLQSGKWHSVMNQVWESTEEDLSISTGRRSHLVWFSQISLQQTLKSITLFPYNRMGVTGQMANFWKTDNFLWFHHKLATTFPGSDKPWFLPGVDGYHKGKVSAKKP